MWEVLIIVAVLVIWFFVSRYIFPKMGIPV